MKIGIVDLDTSHPQNWIPIERELGHYVAGVWDGGEVHPPEYVEDFAKKHQLPKLYPSLEAMAAEVDCAVLHSCNWDTRIERARPFVEAGKAVLLDKPVAGRPGDLRQLLEWEARGVRLTGGSSLRFCNEVQDYLARPESERGKPHTVICGCGVDEFNYGIHAYSLLAGLMGGGAQGVRHLGEGGQRRVQVRWADGRTGLLVIGATTRWLPFHATVITDRDLSQFQVDAGRLYRALLEKILPYLEGKAPAPMPLRELMEPERWALAARRSWLEGDREVPLDELGEDGYEGAAFARFYREQKYGKEA
ncbi:MAG: Gfo/Idh/MocA family oxidoreductase [Candidatus Latescibacteria bacterium]|nr:Gfo/Idh/MocA family oxidoreductase [Candidatus Latescibacterota bacterium]